MESKEIKVYGTLVNHTQLAGDLPINTTATNHNDVIAYAYQLYDDRFSSTASENYQDVINKRLTGITYDPQSDTTTIDNNLIVNGDTNINGDTHIDGDTTIEGDLHVTESFVVDGDISGISLGNLSNVSSTADSASAGTFLKFDGSEWVPAVIALSDIDGFDSIGTPSEGDIIKYVNNQWTFTKNKLDELYDVDITNKANGSILKWNSTSNKWEIGTDSTGSILPAGDEGKVLKYINGQWVAGDDNDTKLLSALNDVTLSTMAVGQVLRYNGSKWVNAKLSIDDLEMPAATAGQVLKFNGNKWVADTDETGGGGATKLSELSDVDSSVDNATDGSVLKYDESAGKWKAVDESSTPSSDGYIYRTQTAHITKVKSMFVGSEDVNRSSSPSTTFGIIYPNNRYIDIYVSNDIVLEDGESIYSCLIAELPSERGQMIYNSGVSLMPAEHSWTTAANGQSYTWSVDSTHSYSISPGTRKTTTPIKGYNTVGGGVYNRDITVYAIQINNGVTPPTFSTNPNYDPAKDTSLRSTKHFLYQASGQYVEVTSKSNYKAAISNDFTFASEISQNGTITRYGVLATGYKERMSGVYPYPWLTTDFYKAVVSDNATRIDYTSISESEAVSKMTFVDIPYGQCVATFGYDKSCITMPNSLAITVRTRKRAS